MRVLLDTNILISRIHFRGVPRTLLERAMRGKFDLVTNAALRDELEDVLVRSVELLPALARAVRTKLETLGEVVAPADVPAVSRDPDDQVLAAAVVGQADAVVTGDQDLLVLETHQTIPIIRPADLVARLKPAEEDG